MFAWVDDDALVTRAFTDRAGGTSAVPYAELNLGDHVGDDSAAVAANRAALAGAIGLAPKRLVFMRQVHGARVAVITGADLDGGDPAPAPPEADAMVTLSRDVGLVVMVADCIPVLLDDRGGGPVGVAHVGRPGLARGVLPEVVAALRELGAADLRAVLGPSVCAGCYEVPADLRAEVAALVPESFAWTRARTPALDLLAGARAQLQALGVHSEVVAGCTRERDDLFSFRRDAVTGRFGGVIVRRAA